jgi:TorA maturation chaperone TorD
MLLYPEGERLKTIAAAAAELHEQSPAMVEFMFFTQWQRFLTSLVDLPHQPALDGEYIQVFMHNALRTPCLPYESSYVDPGGQAAGWVAALLEQEYAASGLALSPSLKDLPDHVAVELEFMAFLCDQEADAWHRQDVKEGIQSLKRQAGFLDRHLSRWFPDWARQVAAADGEGIYSVVAETARIFISHDQDLVGTLLDNLERMPQGSQGRESHKGSYCSAR